MMIEKLKKEYQYVGRAALINLTDESTIQSLKNLLAHRRDIAKILITNNPSVSSSPSDIDNLHDAYRHVNKQIKLLLELKYYDKNKNSGV